MVGGGDSPVGIDIVQGSRYFVIILDAFYTDAVKMLNQQMCPIYVLRTCRSSLYHKLVLLTTVDHDVGGVVCQY